MPEELSSGADLAAGGWGRWNRCTWGDVMHVGRRNARRRTNDIIAASPPHCCHIADNGGQVYGNRKEMTPATALTYIILMSYNIILLRAKLKIRLTQV